MPEEQKQLKGLVLGATVVYRRPNDEAERAAIVVDVGDGTGRNATLLVLGLPNESLSYAQHTVFDDRADHAGGTWRWLTKVA